MLVAIAIILIHSIRNFIIIKNIQKNISNYETSNNYHIKSIAKETVNATMKIDFYKKGNKAVTFIERTNPQGTIKVAMYDDGQKVDMFTDNGKEKTCKIGAGSSVPTVQLVNYIQTDNDWQTFFLGTLAFIKEEKYNQKDCYVINNYTSPDVLYSNGKNEIYIEKETGLCLKSITGEQVAEREYEFNNVPDSIFVEPDISEYKILQN